MSVLDALRLDGKVAVVRGGVTDRASSQPRSKRVASELGPGRRVVNNAGVCFHGPALAVRPWRYPATDAGRV